MKRIALISCVILGWASMAVAQSRLSGQIFEKVAGREEPLPFVTVLEVGTNNGTRSDFDGKFSLILEPGTHQVRFSSVGYKEIIKEYVIQPGEQKKIQITMEENNVGLEEVVVEAKLNQASENILIQQQQESEVITQSMGAKQMERVGVSDVAHAATKVSGVAMKSQQLYVRGLGDRYNVAQMNGLPIASPNPELKVIPLDIFPTKVVDNIGINKVFMPENYADYSGALINIRTKDYPEKGFLKMSVSGSYNTRSTFRNFRKTDGGGNDFWGFDDGSRALPEEINNQIIYRPTPSDQNSSPFTTGFGFTEGNAPMDFSASAIGGNTYKLGETKKLGIVASLSYDNKFTFREGIYKNLNTQYEPRVDYDYINYGFSTNTAGMLNLSLELNKKNSLRYIFMFVNSSDDELAEYEGLNRDQGNELFIRRSTYRQHSLMTNQLLGTHTLNKKETWDMDWAFAYAAARSDEPDRRQLVYQEIAEGEYAFNSLDAANNNRFFSELDEKEWSARGGFHHGFQKNEETDKFRGDIKFGGQFKTKERDFHGRQFNYDMDPIWNGTVVDVDRPDDYITDENIESGLIHIIEQPNPSGKYSADLTVSAAYALVDYDLSQKLNMAVGGRMEISEQNVYYKKLQDPYASPFKVSTLEAIDFFPAIHMKYTVNEKSNLRFAASQTISRPEFKEMAPFLYVEIFGGSQILGNENLTNAYNYNVDVKYEIFPGLGEMVAFSAFAKYLEKPIERVVTSNSTQLYSFINTDEAYVAGVEFEVNKRLGEFGDTTSLWSRVTVGGNISLLYSQINIVDNSLTLNTNSKRPLQGASPYIANADVNYDFEINKVKSRLTLVYNVFGSRIYSAGSNGAGDIYERPVNTLDVLFKNRLTPRLSLDFSFKNILDPEIKREQETDGEPVLVHSYHAGSRMGVGISYRF